MENNHTNDIQAKFNESYLAVQRLSNLWQQASYNYMQGNYAALCTVLDCIYVELSADAKRRNKQYDTQMKKINFDINKASYEMRRVQAELENVNYCTPKDVDRELHQSLARARSRYVGAIMAKQFFLKDLQQSVGKGSSYKNALEDEIE